LRRGTPKQSERLQGQENWKPPKRPDKNKNGRRPLGHHLEPRGGKWGESKNLSGKEPDQKGKNAGGRLGTQRTGKVCVKDQEEGGEGRERGRMNRSAAESGNGVGEWQPPWTARGKRCGEGRKREQDS